MHYRNDCIKSMLSCMISDELEFQTDVQWIQVKVGRLSYKINLNAKKRNKKLWHQVKRDYDEKLEEKRKLVETMVEVFE